MNKKEASMERNKEKWECEKCSCSEAQHGQSSCGLIVWPPKNYNCSFCQREFRSAQALGGHMNVHRRDRARLRMLPPPLRQYRNPNPIPSFATSSSSSSSSLSSPPSNKLLLPGPGPATYNPKPLVSASLNSLSSSPSSTAFTNEEKKRLLEECPQQINTLSCTLPAENYLRKKKTMRAAFGAGNSKGYAPNREIDVLRKKEKLAMSLDLEMGLKETKEAVDLELRLGYP